MVPMRPPFQNVSEIWRKNDYRFNKYKCIKQLTNYIKLAISSSLYTFIVHEIVSKLFDCPSEFTDFYQFVKKIVV